MSITKFFIVLDLPNNKTVTVPKYFNTVTNTFLEQPNEDLCNFTADPLSEQLYVGCASFCEEDPLVQQIIQYQQAVQDDPTCEPSLALEYIDNTATAVCDKLVKISNPSDGSYSLEFVELAADTFFPKYRLKCEIIDTCTDEVLSEEILMNDPLSAGQGQACIDFRWAMDLSTINYINWITVYDAFTGTQYQLNISPSGSNLNGCAGSVTASELISTHPNYANALEIVIRNAMCNQIGSNVEYQAEDYILSVTVNNDGFGNNLLEINWIVKHKPTSTWIVADMTNNMQYVNSSGQVAYQTLNVHVVKPFSMYKQVYECDKLVAVSVKGSRDNTTFSPLPDSYNCMSGFTDLTYNNIVSSTIPESGTTIECASTPHQINSNVECCVVTSYNLLSGGSIIDSNNSGTFYLEANGTYDVQVNCLDGSTITETITF